MRFALAQINTVVGELDGNRQRILAAVDAARAAGAELVITPELAVTAYPPEDLLLRPAFVEAAEASTREIAAACTGIVALVGTPWRFGDELANACAVCTDGEIRALYRKRLLPNYGVFDEARYFVPGEEVLVVPLGGLALGLTVCEDVWQPGPAADLAAAGAELLVNLSASPFHVGKAEEREEMLASRARDNGLPLVFCNAVGGQDELLFDGHSVVLDARGEVLARAPGFEEHLLVVDLGTPGEVAPFAPPLEQMLLESGCPGQHLAVRVEHDRVPVEQQLVLTADRIAEDERHAVVLRPRRQHRFAILGLAHVERRCGEVDDELRSCGRKVGGGLGLPDVLADRETDLQLPEHEHEALLAGVEVPRLVEDAVVRQQPLAVQRPDLAVGADGTDIGELVVERPRRPDERHDVGAGRRDLARRLLCGPDERWTQQQVLGRVRGYGELGRDEHIRSGRSCLGERGEDPLTVAVEVADYRIDLCQREPHAPPGFRLSG